MRMQIACEYAMWASFWHSQEIVATKRHDLALVVDARASRKLADAFFKATMRA